MGTRARLVATDVRGPVTVLTFEAQGPFRFAAGQYLRLVHPEGGIPMSIASAPARLPFFELHYRPVAGAPDAERMDALLAASAAGRNDSFGIAGPFGDVTARATPTFLVAAGTGAAQATGFLEWLRELDAPPATVLWWSVSTPADLYQDDYFAGLSRSDWFEYRAFVDRPSGENTLLPALRNASLVDEIILSGPPGFVHAAARTLERQGVPRPHLHSDM